jgi:hypothetical protein
MAVLTVDVPAPDEPVIATMGYLTDMTGLSLLSEADRLDR